MTLFSQIRIKHVTISVKKYSQEIIFENFQNQPLFWQKPKNHFIFFTNKRLQRFWTKLIDFDWCKKRLIISKRVKNYKKGIWWFWVRILMKNSRKCIFPIIVINLKIKTYPIQPEYCFQSKKWFLLVYYRFYYFGAVQNNRVWECWCQILTVYYYGTHKERRLLSFGFLVYLL